MIVNNAINTDLKNMFTGLHDIFSFFESPQIQFPCCYEISINGIAKRMQHVGIIRSFCLRWGTCSFFQCFGGEKKLLVCGLLRGD